MLHARPAANPPIESVDVYPTVSDQLSANANLAIDPGARRRDRPGLPLRADLPRLRTDLPPADARGAAQPRQAHPQRSATAKPDDSLQAAFETYLRNYNRGRGIVFNGHSQGATVLINLLERRIDEQRALPRRLVSALLIGGNVAVGPGGDFEHIPPCATTTQTGCVVAYSTFLNQPPKGAYFGRDPSALDPFAPNAPKNNILGVNPASPAGGTAPRDTYAPTPDAGARAKTPWGSKPGEYTARCERRDGASRLQIQRPGGTADIRPAVSESEGPDRGSTSTTSTSPSATSSTSSERRPAPTKAAAPQRGNTRAPAP